MPTIGYMCKSCGQHYIVLECKPTVVGVAYKSRRGCPQESMGGYLLCYLLLQTDKTFLLRKKQFFCCGLLHSPKMGSTRNKKRGIARSGTVVEFNCLTADRVITDVQLNCKRCINVTKTKNELNCKYVRH